MHIYVCPRLRVEAPPEPLSAGRMYPVPSSRPQQGEKAVTWLVWIFKPSDSPSLTVAAPGVNIL